MKSATQLYKQSFTGASTNEVKYYDRRSSKFIFQKQISTKNSSLTYLIYLYLSFYRPHRGRIRLATQDINDSLRWKPVILHVGEPIARVFLGLRASREPDHGAQSDQNAALRLLFRGVRDTG